MRADPPAHDAAAIAEIAKGLTKAQRERIGKSDVLMLRNRWDTRIAMGLERKGVAQRGTHLNQFILTPLGLSVRASLAQSKGEE